jgi:hypothetical protein
MHGYKKACRGSDQWEDDPLVGPDIGHNLRVYTLFEDHLAVSLER